jgi:hypothetical protein
MLSPPFTVMKSQRRTFMIYAASAGAATALSTQALAQKPALELVKDTDPTAVSLGYKTDGTKTDRTKYPKYAPNQNCANCALWVGPTTAATGACALFPNKLVAAKAWCSAWVKKA